jgi:branched-chain amino acid aminotransferase
MAVITINFNGQLIPEDTALFKAGFRGIRYGDGLFETLYVQKSDIVYLEDHYFRLMASMRMLRMEIPMHFTMQFMQDEITKTLNANSLDEARVRYSIYRDAGGHYAPDSQSVIYLVEVAPYRRSSIDNYRIDLFRDFYINPDLLSTVKTTNKMLHILASIYVREHGFDNVVLMNQNKRIVEATNANVFMVTGSVIRTPPLTEGCIKGIMRKKVIGWVKDHPDLELQEEPFTHFEMLKADELFLTNSLIGIQPVSSYRKKTYVSEVSSMIGSGIDRSI